MGRAVQPQQQRGESRRLANWTRGLTTDLRRMLRLRPGATSLWRRIQRRSQPAIRTSRSSGRTRTPCPTPANASGCGDAADNPADAVQYYDDGRWPEAADAGGASLELRDPRADNNAGEAWAASDESSRSAWRTYSYRGVAAASAVGPDGQWKEFVMGLLDQGVVLLDDIAVIETPATTPTNLIRNGTFDPGTNTWRIMGNHHGEVIDDPDQPGNKVLKLTATGSTEHMSNHGETTLVGNRDVVNGREYLISFRAKWISGSRQFHTRLYFNRLARTTLLDAPSWHGTPGMQNTAFHVKHRADLRRVAPHTSGAGRIRAGNGQHRGGRPGWGQRDGALVAARRRFLEQDRDDLRRGGVAAFQRPDPWPVCRSVVQFYVEGTDDLGAQSFFPAGGTNSARSTRWTTVLPQ